MHKSQEYDFMIFFTYVYACTHYAGHDIDTQVTLHTQT